MTERAAAGEPRLRVIGPADTLAARSAMVGLAFAIHGESR
jgi:hypothetical protein